MTSSGTPAGRLEDARGLLRTGRVRAARAALDALAVDGLLPAERAQRDALLLTCELASGDLDAARATGERLAAQEPAVEAALALGELAAALGDHAGALAHLRRAAALTGDPGTWRPGAAMALVHTGDRSAAATLAGEELRLAELAEEPRALAVALRTSTATDPAVDPFTSLRRARALASAAGDRRLTAQVDADLATLLLLVPSANSLTEARGLLRTAEAYAAAEGLEPLHARLVRLLVRLGERARPRPGAALGLLTPAEERVARLAVAGLTNRQVAAEVGVSVKGVEWHLSRIYRKLGIDSRADLGPLLAASDAPDGPPA